ncbi:tetratricopeptide repeat protein [Spirillospora sp. NPDC050679]
MSGQIATGDNAAQSQQNAHHTGPGPFVQAAPDSTINIGSVPAILGQEAGWLPVSLPPHAGELFVGREAELARLDAAFAATAGGGAAAVVHQRVGAVHGLGGIGKSTLAAQWAHRHRDEFDLVWWVVAGSRQAVWQELARLAVALDPGLAGRELEALAEAALGWLNCNGGWLLVLGNVTGPAEVADLLARLKSGSGGPGGRVLVTTRLATGWARLVDHTIALDVLPLDQAVELLTRTVTAERSGADLTGAAELCAELGCLPLAIDQAAGYLIDNHAAPGDYLDLLADYPAELFDQAPAGRQEQIDQTIARTWYATLDHLAADTPLAELVLRTLAWVAPEGIPRTLLDHLPGFLRAGQDQAVPVTRVRAAVARLAAYNMITLSDDGQTISVHRLVQAVARIPAPDDLAAAHRTADITTARGLATRLLEQACPNNPYEPTAWPVWRVLLPHINALADYAHPDWDTEIFSLLLDRTALFLRDQGALTSAINYCARALAASQRLRGADHPGTLSLRNNLALAYWESGAGDFAARAGSGRPGQGADHPDSITGPGYRGRYWPCRRPCTCWHA